MNKYHNKKSNYDILKEFRDFVSKERAKIRARKFDKFLSNFFKKEKDE